MPNVSGDSLFLARKCRMSQLILIFSRRGGPRRSHTGSRAPRGSRFWPRDGASKVEDVSADFVIFGLRMDRAIMIRIVPPSVKPFGGAPKHFGYAPRRATRPSAKALGRRVSSDSTRLSGDSFADGMVGAARFRGAHKTPPGARTRTVCQPAARAIRGRRADRQKTVFGRPRGRRRAAEIGIPCGLAVALARIWCHTAYMSKTVRARNPSWGDAGGAPGAALQTGVPGNPSACLTDGVLAPLGPKRDRR